MAIKFEKIYPGMTLLDVRRTTMGHTTMSEWSWWDVRIVSVDAKTKTARVVWNTMNPEETYSQRQLERLYTKLPKACRDQQERRRGGDRWS